MDRRLSITCLRKNLIKFEDIIRQQYISFAQVPSVIIEFKLNVNS